MLFLRSQNTEFNVNEAKKDDLMNTTDLERTQSHSWLSPNAEYYKNCHRNPIYRTLVSIRNRQRKSYWPIPRNEHGLELKVLALISTRWLDGIIACHRLNFFCGWGGGGRNNILNHIATLQLPTHIGGGRHTVLRTVFQSQTGTRTKSLTDREQVW